MNVVPGLPAGRVETEACPPRRSEADVARTEPGAVLRERPPEIGYWERGEWRLAGNLKPWQPEAVTVAGDRLVFRPRLKPVA